MPSNKNRTTKTRNSVGDVGVPVRHKNSKQEYEIRNTHEFLKERFFKFTNKSKTFTAFTWEKT